MQRGVSSGVYGAAASVQDGVKRLTKFATHMEMLQLY
jgi:hypothetical protein